LRKIAHHLKGVDTLLNAGPNQVHTLYVDGDHKIIAGMFPTIGSLAGLPFATQLEAAWSHHLEKTKEYGLIIQITENIRAHSELDDEIRSAYKLEPLARRDRGDKEGALKINTEALDRYSGDGEQWNTQANLLIGFKRYSEALAAASTAVLLAKKGYAEEADPTFLRHLGHGLRAMAICIKEVISPIAAKETAVEAKRQYIASQVDGWNATTHIEGINNMLRKWGLMDQEGIE